MPFLGSLQSWSVARARRRAAPGKDVAKPQSGCGKTWLLQRNWPPSLGFVSTNSGRPRILLVEDEDSISDPFARALAREGFEPVVAKTAAEALKLAASVEPELVLLDLMLPDGDGRDVCRELRRRSQTPIIMLTARGTETDRIVGLELGADDYVVKPFSSPEVIARIRAVLRRSRRDGDEEARLRFGELQVDSEARRVRIDDN